MKQKTWIKRISYSLLTVLVIFNSQLVWAVQPYNMPEGVTAASKTAFDLHMLVFYICCGIGVVVFSILTYSIVMHRKSIGHKPAVFHESLVLEFLWTIIPFAILIVIAIPAARALIEMEDTTNSDMTIKITGYQWMWRYEYIDHDIDFYSVLSTPRGEIYNKQQKNENYLLEVDNELVIPINHKVRILLTSNDVIHAWWVPELAFKKDAIPGYINQGWTEVTKPGVYRGQCAELCGRDHGFMPIVVRAVEPEEFEQWVAEQNVDKNLAANERAANVLTD